MENLWQSTISNLQNEIPIDIYESLLNLPAPLGFTDVQDPNKFSITVERNLHKRIDSKIKAAIEAKLQTNFSNKVTLNLNASKNTHINQGYDWLNPKFTFETFIETQSNQLAFLACEAIALQPGRSNPFYINANPGMGKTHLIQGLIHLLLKRTPQAKIYYNNFSDFKDDFTNSLNNHTVLEYKKSLRNYDVLVIENIEELANCKKSIANEFFHIFNYYYENEKQIIFTANIKASELNLKGSLNSRLLSGLQVKIFPPDKKLIKEIIINKSKSINLDLDKKLEEKLINHRIESIREIESILNRLFFLKQKNIKVQNITQLQENFLTFFDDSNQLTFPIENIVKIVCKKFKITHEEITGSSRKSEYTLPRHIGMYLAVQYSDLNKSAIARFFKKSDHTTVINAEKNITKRIQKEKGFSDILADITTNLKLNCG